MKRKTNKHHNLSKALRKLENSSTALTRKRARNAVRSALNKLLKDYPLLNDDGQEKVPAKKPCCPLCKAPMASWAVLAVHLAEKHCNAGLVERRCPCCRELFQNPKGVAKHLQAVYKAGRLHEHVVAGATSNAFKDGDGEMQFMVVATRVVLENAEVVVEAKDRDEAWKRFKEIHMDVAWTTEDAEAPDESLIYPYPE